LRTFNRRAWVPAVLTSAALVLAGCGGDDGSGGGGGGGGDSMKITYSLPTPESLLFYPPLVAEELGFFEQEGVEAEFVTAGEEIPSTALVENGDVDLAMADIDELVISHAKGGTQKVPFSPQHQNTAGTVVPEDSEIQEFSELSGKTVGLASEEDTSQVEAQLLAAGLSGDDIETVVVGTSGALIKKTFEDGEIDAYVGARSDFTAIEATGTALRNITPEDVQAIDGNPTAVMPETLESKREALVAFLRAWSMGQYVGLEHPDVVEQIVRDRVPAEWRNEDVAKAALAGSIELMRPDDPERIGDVRPEVWTTAQDLLASVGIIEEKVDIDNILDDSLIEEINDFDRAEVDAAVEEWQQENGG
jgi:NitT/TauT family transport system substrate-binding protein